MKIHFHPIKSIRALYYANRPIGTYKPLLRPNVQLSFMPPEPTFGEKLKNTIELILHKH